MPTRRSLLRRLKLRTVLVVALLLSGIIPLGISSVRLIVQSYKVLRNTEQDNLTGEAKSLSQEIDSHLVAARRQLEQLGEGILVAPGPPQPAARLSEPWVAERLKSFQRGNPDVMDLRVLDPEGAGLGRSGLSREAEIAMNTAFEAARDRKAPAYRLVAAGLQAVLAVPVPVGAREPALIVEAQLRFPPLQKVSRNVAHQGVDVSLLDNQGKILWSTGGSKLGPQALRSLIEHPMAQTSEFKLGKQEIFVQASPIPETAWMLVVQKPVSQAFADVNRMIFNAALSTVLLIALSLFFSYLAARWVSRPIQRLAETTHEIAAGKFGGSVEMQGLTFELADLAEDFNRMSGQVAGYVQQLRQAASANRDLFIGLLRALVAAVDAKDPYTRGHSERVAAFSRTIGRYLQLPEEVQHKVWIGALLHDVGKIGVEDRILRKDGVLAPEE
ncbi:MAG TPA: HAMP domain-containing protein, partial [Thermoanaerobaculia bacterium]